MSARVAQLRALLEQRFPDTAPLPERLERPIVATGIGGLDRVLPGGGLSKGKLTVCPPQGGATSIFRAACRGIVGAGRGERAAWVDGAGTVAGTFWDEGPVLIRPKSSRHALRAAEEILRSEGFTLVVLAGAEPQGTETVRLIRAAAEGGTALVALTERAALSSVRLTTRIHPHDYRWRRDPFGEPADVYEVVVRVHARAPGWNAHADFPIPVMQHELRLSLEPGLADRRGVLPRRPERP
jgi:hypothetical protein